MKRTHTPSHASGVLTIEDLRKHFRLPELEAEPAVQFKFKPGSLKVERIQPGTNRQRLHQALSIYDGVIPFASWLQGMYVATAELQFLKEFLQTSGWAVNTYLQKVSRRPPKEAQGDMLARIQFMWLEISMRQLLLRHKLKPFRSIMEMTDHDLTLMRTLKMGNMAMMDEMQLIRILDESHTAQEVGLKFVAWQYHKKTERNCRSMLWQLLTEYHCNRFCSLASKKGLSIETMSAYLLTMMECLHLLNRDDPHWSMATTRAELDKIVTFYNHIGVEDNNFINAHFPGTLIILRKKRPVNFERLHLIWMQHKIYKLARKSTNFRRLKLYIQEYQQWSGIEISYDLEALRTLYAGLIDFDQAEANRLLLKVVSVRPPGSC